MNFGLRRDSLILSFFLITFLIIFSPTYSQSVKENHKIQLITVGGLTVGPCEFYYEAVNAYDKSSNNFYYYAKNPLIEKDTALKVSFSRIKEISNFSPAQEVPKGTGTAFIMADLTLNDNSKQTIYVWFADRFKLSCSKSKSSCEYNLSDISTIKIINNTEN